MVFTTINTKTWELVHDCKDLPVTPDSRLNWFGYSEQGNLYSYDSTGHLRTFINNGLWGTVLSPKGQSGDPSQIDSTFQINQQTNLWAIGVDEGLLCAIRLGYEDSEPNPLAKLNPSQVKFRLPIENQELHALAAQSVQNFLKQEQHQQFGFMGGVKSGVQHEDTMRDEIPSV